MKKFIPWILAGAFFIIGVATLSHYGMHEDSPFHFLRGQYFLERILGKSGEFDIPTTGSPVLFVPGQRISQYKPNASEELFSPLRPVLQNDKMSVQQVHQEVERTEGKRISFYKHNAWTENIWELMDNQGHPAISDMLMSVTNRVTYELFGVLSDVDGYHVYALIVVAVSLIFLYIFVADAFGPVAAVVAVISLAMYPMVWAESHFNIKDPVEMGYYMMTVVSWYFTVTKRLSVDWLMLCIVSVFLALGTKWNILFVPFTLIPWTIFVWYKSPLRGQVRLRRLLLFSGISIVIPLIVLLFAYPFFWTQTIYKLLNTFSYYSTLAVRDLRVQQPSPIPLFGGLDARAGLFFLSMSPPFMLILALTGALGLMFRKYAIKYKAGLLVALWFIVPFLRVIWQRSEVFGSVRHFMEFIPAFTVLVGAGSALVLHFAGHLPLLKKVSTRMLQGIFIGAFVMAHATLLIRLHPYEHIYFNGLVGGLRGAQSIGLYTWETLYDAPYRQLASWVNAHAQKDAHLAHLDGTMFAVSPIWLREDIRIGSYFSGLEAKGEYIASIVYPKPPAVFPYNYLEAFVRPVYEIKKDGVVIAKVWKNDPEHTTMSGVRRTVDREAMKVERSVFRGSDRVDTVIPTAIRVLKVTVAADDIRCITQRNLVWSIVDESRETFMFPWISQDSETTAVVSFPGTHGNILRLLDIERTGCGTKVHISRVEGLQ